MNRSQTGTEIAYHYQHRHHPSLRLVLFTLRGVPPGMMFSPRLLLSWAPNGPPMGSHGGGGGGASLRQIDGWMYEGIGYPLSVCIFIDRYIYIYMYTSIHLYLYRSVCRSDRLPARLSAHLPTRPSIHPSVHISLWLLNKPSWFWQTPKDQLSIGPEKEKTDSVDHFSLLPKQVWFS